MREYCSYSAPNAARSPCCAARTIASPVFRSSIESTVKAPNRFPVWLISADRNGGARRVPVIVGIVCDHAQHPLTVGGPGLRNREFPRFRKADQLKRNRLPLPPGDAFGRSGNRGLFGGSAGSRFDDDNSVPLRRFRIRI